MVNRTAALDAQIDYSKQTESGAPRSVGVVRKELEEQGIPLADDFTITICSPQRDKKPQGAGASVKSQNRFAHYAR